MVNYVFYIIGIVLYEVSLYISLMKNLKKMVAELLEELEVGYVINEEKSSFEFDLQAEYVKVSMCLVFHEANRMLYNLSYLTSCLPREV